MKKCGVFRDSVGTVNFEKVLLCKSVTLFLQLDLVFKTRLKDQYLQTWTDDVASNAKCINYRMYKSDISLEFYITFLPMKLRTVFSCFRCRNHKLPVETGIYKNIPRSERVCVKCTQLVMNFIIYLTVHFLLIRDAHTYRSIVILCRHPNSNT